MKTKSFLQPFFENKAILITGASSGIGKAFAKLCLSHHAQVIATGRSKEKLQNLQNFAVRLQRQENLQTIVLDLNTKKSVEILMQEVSRHHDKLDIVVHCAGLSFRGSSIQTESDVYKKLMQVNFFAVSDLFRLSYPLLLASTQSSFAAVISMQGLFSIPKRAPYIAAKHALRGYLNGVRMESDIHVMSIYPGYVDTPGSAAALTEDGSEYGKLDKHRSKGLSPDTVALEIAKGLYFQSREIFIAGMKERFAYFLSRYFPNLLDEFFAKKNFKDENPDDSKLNKKRKKEIKTT